MSTPTRAIDVLPDDRHERVLIKRLLAHLAARQGRTWMSLDFPEDRIRTREAVQVIAMEQNGRTSAIEHVAVGGFPDDTHRFRAEFDALEDALGSQMPGFYVDVEVPIEAVPAAVDARLVANGIRGWCERHLAAVTPGRSTHVIMVSGASLRIQVEKTAAAGQAARIVATRANPPLNFETVVREGLAQKLPRLAAVSADRRVLVVERHDGIWNVAQLRLELEGASLEFPELNGLSEIWLADTVSRKDETAVAWHLVSQNGEG